MLKSVLTGVVTFLVVVGLLFMFQRESNILQNQATISQGFNQLNKRVAGIEQFLSNASKRQEPNKELAKDGKEKRL